MQYLFFLLLVLIINISTAMAASVPTTCTTEYAPVCGSIQVQCITAPCYPVRQTFANSCTANVSHANTITDGTCDTSVIISPVSIGGDRDQHGCIGFSGYHWDPRIGGCIRPWESRIRILTIAPEPSSCLGVASLMCLQVYSAGQRSWQDFYGSISGFNYVSGYTYRLLVLETEVTNVPIDGLSLSYTLIKVLSKKLKPMESF